MGAEVFEKAIGFVLLFAQPDHEAGFSEHAGTVATGEVQHIERLLVIRLRTDLAVKPRHGFHIVIEHVRPGIQHPRHGLHIAAKIGRQYLDTRLRQRITHLANRLREMPRTTIRQVVPVHAGDHAILHPHGLRHTGDIARFRRVERHIHFAWIALRHRTEAATARAQVAKNHESCRAPVEAFVNIRAPRRFTHGMQVQFPQTPLQRVHGFEVRGAFSRPRRQPPGLRFNLDQRFGTHRAINGLSNPAAFSFALASTSEGMSL